MLDSNQTSVRRHGVKGRTPSDYVRNYADACQRSSFGFAPCMRSLGHSGLHHDANGFDFKVPAQHRFPYEVIRDSDREYDGHVPSHRRSTFSEIKAMDSHAVDIPTHRFPDPFEDGCS